MYENTIRPRESLLINVNIINKIKAIYMFLVVMLTTPLIIFTYYL